MTRHVFVWLHRWAGLVMAAFLILVSLTGSLLAFKSELEHLIAPQLFAAGVLSHASNTTLWRHRRQGPIISRKS